MTIINNHGYRKLIVWRNLCILRKRIHEITSRFPRGEWRRVEQMRDAARSTKQNIQEGYCQSLNRYIYVLKNIVKGSLNELTGDIEDCYDDKLITEEEFKELKELCGKTDYLLNRQIWGLEKLREKKNQPAQ